MSGLTPQQLDFYREQGYLLVEDALDPAVFDLLRSEVEEVVDGFAREALADGRITEPHEEEPFERRLHRLALDLGDPEPLLALVRGKMRSPGMFRIYACEALLDIVESVIGPEILAHPQFNIRAKRPGVDEGVVPWHQDLGYLEPSAAETFMVNFWIPLVDATLENGCLEVIAGSQRSELIEHQRGMGPAGNFKGVVDEELPPGRARTVPGAHRRRAADPAHDDAPLAAEPLRPHPLEPGPALLTPRSAHRAGRVSPGSSPAAGGTRPRSAGPRRSG